MPTAWLYRILGIAAAAAAVLWLMQSRDHWRDEARAKGELFRQEKAAHAATVANYRAAAEAARREDSATLARVRSEQERINERTQDDYESRIASARARAHRLRDQAADYAADPGSGAATPVSRIPAAAQGAPQPSGADRLSLAERQLATEQAIQLDELIKWVRRQAAVPLNGGSGARQPGEAAAGRQAAIEPSGD